MNEKTGDFLNRLPQAMDKELRIFLEVISIATDIVNLSYKEIFDASHKLVLRGDQADFAEPFEFEDMERVLIFRACWSMIDQCNTIRIALSTAKFFGGKKDHDFFKAAGSAKKLRDKMDHLGANWRNHSRTKRVEPILGLLTFYWTKEGDIEILPDGKRICHFARTVLAFGSSIQGAGGTNIVQCNPGDREWHPVGNFILYSFNEMVNLTELHRCVMEVRGIVEAYAETTWKEIIDQQAKIGTSLEALSTTLIRPLVTVVEDQYSNPIEISQNGSQNPAV